MDLHLGDTRRIIAACKDYGLLRNQAAYVLSTAYHESAHTMKPVRETLASTDAKAKERLTKAWKAGKLPGVKSDYWSSGYFGRGYVQITHIDNYRKAGDRLGIGSAFVANPSFVMEPRHAVLILVRGMKEGWFRGGKKLSDFITLMDSDFIDARDIINGDKKKNGALIAGYAIQYNRLLTDDGYGVSPLPQIKPADHFPDAGTMIPPVPVQPVPSVPVSEVALEDERLPVGKPEAKGWFAELIARALKAFRPKG